MMDWQHEVTTKKHSQCSTYASFGNIFSCARYVVGNKIPFTLVTNELLNKCIPYDQEEIKEHMQSRTFYCMFSVKVNLWYDSLIGNMKSKTVKHYLSKHQEYIFDIQLDWNNLRKILTKSIGMQLSLNSLPKSLTYIWDFIAQNDFKIS